MACTTHHLVGHSHAHDIQAEGSTQQGTGKPASKRKRKRQEEGNEFLPDRSAEELEEQTYGSLEFNEVLDEEVRPQIFMRTARWHHR